MSDIRTVDPKGRITLPPGWGGALVQFEEQPDGSLTIRRVRVVPESSVLSLSDADWEKFENSLTDPPEPNEHLKNLMNRNPERK